MNIFLFHGTDSFTSAEKVSNWKKAFLAKHQQSALETIQGKKLDIQKFKLNALSMPFLADKKLLILKDFFASNKAEALKEMSDIIEQIPESTILVFQENTKADKRTSLYKKLKKKLPSRRIHHPRQLQTPKLDRKTRSKNRPKHLLSKHPLPQQPPQNQTSGK